MRSSSPVMSTSAGNDSLRMAPRIDNDGWDKLINLLVEWANRDEQIWLEDESEAPSRDALSKMGAILSAFRLGEFRPPQILSVNPSGGVSAEFRDGEVLHIVIVHNDGNAEIVRMENGLVRNRFGIQVP